MKFSEARLWIKSLLNLVIHVFQQLVRRCNCSWVIISILSSSTFIILLYIRSQQYSVLRDMSCVNKSVIHFANVFYDSWELHGIKFWEHVVGMCFNGGVNCLQRAVFIDYAITCLPMPSANIVLYHMCEYHRLTQLYYLNRHTHG